MKKEKLVKEVAPDRCELLENKLIEKKNQSLIFQFHHIHNIMFRVANKMINASAVPVKMEQLPVLMTLFYFKAQSQQSVANHINRDKSSVLRTAQALEKKGLLAFTKDEKDARRKVLALTETGKFVAIQVEDLVRDIEKEIGAALSDRPKSELLEILKQSAAKLEDLANS
ncbi:MAG TPA: MarR family transcriptional regulator [Edaphocola sp.]|nr:MarR family transcriptional regulator [Edaphocola sp.]